MELKVTNLSCTRGSIPVLEGVAFSLKPGEILILRGPNGIGKTTLLRTLAGLQPPLTGDVACEPETIAYGAHSDGLKATLSVSENLRFWANIYGTSDVQPALDAFDLNGLTGRQAHNLSAGQKRRLGLARLLVTGRPIWALDEPTVSLDTASVKLFADAVRSHCAQGGAAVIATHIDLDLDARVLELAPFQAQATDDADFDGVFL